MIMQSHFQESTHVLLLIIYLHFTEKGMPGHFY